MINNTLVVLKKNPHKKKKKINKKDKDSQLNKK